MLIQNIKTIVSFLRGTRTALVPSHFPKCSWVSFIRKYGTQAIACGQFNLSSTFKLNLQRWGWIKVGEALPRVSLLIWKPLTAMAVCQGRYGLLGSLRLTLVWTHALICWRRSYSYLLARGLAKFLSSRFSVTFFLSP